MDLLNDFIKETFGGKSICELAQIEQKLQDVKELLKWIDKCSVLEGKLLQKDAEIALINEALEVACEEIEHCPDFIHEVHWGECTAELCEGDDTKCWIRYCLQRGQENIDREKNNKAVHDEIEGRKRMDEQDIMQSAKDEMNSSVCDAKEAL